MKRYPGQGQTLHAEALGFVLNRRTECDGAYGGDLATVPDDQPIHDQREQGTSDGDRHAAQVEP